MEKFLDIIQKRRSIYDISNESILSDEQLKEIVETAVAHTPSAFNTQTSRVIILLGKEHNKLWDIVHSTLEKMVPPENFSKTSEKLASFSTGFATLLFYEEQDTISEMQEKFPLYADDFPGWSLQASGMVQHVIWTALANEGVGISLQHYNPIIDDQVAQTWNIPESWKLIAQMPMGSIVSPAGEKEFLPIETRVKVYGKQ